MMEATPGKDIWEKILLIVEKHNFFARPYPQVAEWTRATRQKKEEALKDTAHFINIDSYPVQIEDDMLL